ncbi:M1 family aminopeptidase [uncultured Aquimarina sp.]|uniref:M1 family aminopeptidase n=1 Tax=uncultured Aquimarina sp. TaxID=575652 RepID=UPI002630E2E0|nr:M1 family aminopeptidase [uncultured Aquimarina sp.]
MFRTFFLKEIVTGLKRPMIYIFLAIFTIISAAGTVNLDITFGGATGNVFKNAPYVVSMYTANLCIIALLIATAYFNNAALKDYQNNFSGILFSTSINKASYYFGRFFGSLFLATTPLLGVFLGFSIGTEISLEAGIENAKTISVLQPKIFINNFLLFVLPNMFVSGAIIFAIANKWKSTIISFIATIIIIVFYLISGTFINDISTEGLAALTDVIGLRAYTIDTKYFTPIEKNTEVVSFSGWLLINRLLWVSIGIGTLMISYFSFSFVQKQQKIKKSNKRSTNNESTQIFYLPKINSSFNFNTSWLQFVSFFKSNLYTILKSNTFKIVLFFGVLILINKLINGFEYYGLQSYHVTSKMLAFNRPISTIMGMIILVFFSGELVWRERKNSINEVIDSTPHISLTILLAKISSLITICLLFDIFLIITSIVYQLFNGYTNPEIGIYLQDFLYAGLPTYVIWSCILISLQIFINSKYLAYFVSILLIFLIEFLVIDILGIKSYMVNLGFSPSYTYSDMNGFSRVLTATNWFNIYWILFGLLLVTIASLFWIRGSIKGIKNRFTSAKKHITKKYALTFFICAFLFGLTASFTYYNTQVLNTYHTSIEIKKMQESYEKKYKKYEHVMQPKTVAIQYNVDIYPNERNIISKSIVTIENKSNSPIDSLHYSLFYFLREGNENVGLQKSNWIKKISIPNSKLVLNDEELGYQIFKLETPLAPNSTMDIIVDTEYISQGFENEISNIRVVENGTFFDSTHILPSTGYEPYNELMNEIDRKKAGLKPRKPTTTLEEKDAENLKENYITRKASDWVDIETIISTADNQIAISPGSLLKKWATDRRVYFKYKNDHQSINFTNFMSARYEVAKKKWNDIDIEVYYHKAHHYNVSMMQDAVEKSLNYYIENFGPYFHKQARIVEIPKYYNFAQAFPGTMPYTEGGGFITNLTNKNDNNVIYSIIAHEMAHQYWAHQVIGANVEGATMLSESFSEYAALMVMKNELKDDLKMKKLLAYDFERYLTGRSNETQKEVPLIKVKDQGYIHYGKGSLVLYALQDYIGEEKVNEALKEFLNAYKYKEAPYPTTLDFITYLKPKIPNHLQFLLTDWFKEITLYEYRIKKATYTTLDTGNYEVNISINASKIKIDSLGKEHKVNPYNWVDIGLFSEDNNKLLISKRVLIDQEEMNFTFEVDQLPVEAVIDPKRLLIELNIDDNTYQIEESN